MTDALSIANLSYRYRHQWTGKRILSLHPFSLAVGDGETFGFLGHNGAGKTTTIKNILHLVTPASGSVHLYGKHHADPAARVVVGYVPEQPYFYDHLRVEEAFRLSAELSGLSGSTMTRRIGEILSRVGLSSRAKAPLRSLSKGLLQRVAIGQAIVAHPRLLILDEPFSGLDPLGRREMRELFEEERRNGTTIFMASHILSDVEYLCDRVSIMARGELKGVFSIPEIQEHTAGYTELRLNSPQHSDSQWSSFPCSLERRGDVVVLRFEEESVAQEALARAVTGGIKVVSFQVHHGTLEDLFVKLVSVSAH